MAGNYITDYYAQETVREIYESLYVPGNPSFPPVFTRREDISLNTHIDFRKQIYGWTSVVGDHKSPNPHSWNKLFLILMQGTSVRTTTYTAANGGYERFITDRSGPNGEQAPSTSIDVDLIEDLAYNKCLEKLYEFLRGSLDLSVSLAEGNQVRRMVNSGLKLSRFMRRWNWKEMANTWLEFQYGWRPLAKDLYDLTKEVSRLAPAAQLVTARGKESKDERLVSNTWPWLSVSDSKVTARVEAKFLYTPTNLVMEQVSRLSSLNPVSIAWEVIPYSFVVDWFCDISSYIRSLESALIVGGLSGKGYITRTCKVTTKYTREGLGANPLNSNVTHTGQQHAENTLTTFSRSVITSLPIPLRPRFNPSLGASRLISAAALLSQFVSQQLPSRERPTRLTNVRFNRTREALERSEFRKGTGTRLPMFSPKRRKY